MSTSALLTRMPRWLAALTLGVLLVGPAAAQPYGPLLYLDADLRDDIGTIPLATALDLVYRAEIANSQAADVIRRAGLSGDPTLVPALWQVARAYSASGYTSYGPQAFFAMLDLGVTPSDLVAEAERVTAGMPVDFRLRREYGPEPGRTQEYVNLEMYAAYALDAAASRADSSLLPRVEALEVYGPQVINGVRGYREVLRKQARWATLSRADRISTALGTVRRGYLLPPAPGEARPSHYATGPLYSGEGLDPLVVWHRARLSELAAQDPPALRAAVESFLTASRAGPYAPGLRAYFLEAASLPLTPGPDEAVPR